MATHVGNTQNTKRTSGDNRWMILSGGTYNFSAFFDDTKVYVNGDLHTTILSKQTTKALTLSPNDIVQGDKPISFSINGNGETGICYAFQGTLFADRRDRYTITYYIVAIDEDANVNVYQNSNTTTYATVTATKDSFSTVAASTAANAQYIFESDKPIAIYRGQLPSFDCCPLYPASLEIYGTPSGSSRIIATEDNTTITEYTSGGSTYSSTLNRGGYKSGSSNAGTQFTGDSTKYVADKPIYAYSIADADGGEMTPYVSKEAFGLQFLIPEDEREFVKFVSDQPATVKAYDTSGTLLSTTTLTGTSTYNVYDARLTGTSSYENVLITSDLPVYGIYEGENDDESILMCHSPETMQVNYGPRVTTDGLYLSFDASNPKSYFGSGTTWTDLMGNYDATLTSATHTSDGEKSYFKFTSGGQAATTSFAEPTANQMTMEVVYMSSSTDTFSTFGRILDRGDTTISLGTANSYQLRMWVYAGGGRSAEAYKDGIGQDGLWHHVVYTYDGTGTAFYLDGEYVMGDSTHTGNLSTPQPLYIGDGDNYPFYGRIALVRYYSKGLTAEEARNNFNALRGRFDI